jgi:hypothetical protein
VKFLEDDVRKDGGSAGETVDMYGELWEIRVCAVPWGTLVLKSPTTHLEAVASLMAAMEEE